MENRPIKTPAPLPGKKGKGPNNCGAMSKSEKKVQAKVGRP